jgi:hypothetical protein
LPSYRGPMTTGGRPSSWPKHWHSEEDDCGDVRRHFGLERFWHGRGIDPAQYCVRGDEPHHGCALGISAEHHLGASSWCWGTRPPGNDMCAGVADTVEARGPIVGGGVVDGIHPDRILPNTGARTHSRRRRLRAARRYHARTPPETRGMRRQTRRGCNEQRRGRKDCSVEEANDVPCAQAQRVPVLHDAIGEVLWLLPTENVDRCRFP